MKDALVTVFGGGGFVGRYVVEALLRAGARVRVAERSPKSAWFLKAQANLGQMTYVAADITRPETLHRAIAGADVVINLVGSFSDMQRVHVDGARNVAEAAAGAGVKSFVHMSAIGADAEGRAVYGRTKGDGEAAVRKAFPKATIMRPSIVFGREDAFINRFAALIRMLPICPIIGGKTRFQPVFVGDVGHAVATAALAPQVHGGAVYELGGPEILSMAQINTWIAERTGRKPFFVDVPDPVAAAMATLTGWLPGAPITRDQWLMLQSDNVVAPKAKGLKALNVAATPLDVVAQGWLVQYRRHGRFGAAA